MRLLVIEDEPDLAGTLEKWFREDDYAVDVALDGEDGLFKASEISYDAIILDLMLPRIDGWSVLQSLRRAGHMTPVLVLSARDEVGDGVRGLDLGADDYLTKPFALNELVARVRALSGARPARRRPRLPSAMSRSRQSRSWSTGPARASI